MGQLKIRFSEQIDTPGFQGVQHGVQHVEAVPHARGEGWGRLPLRQLGNTQVDVCATG